MMRALTRFLQTCKESRVLPRCREVLAELALAVPELAGVRAIKSGHRGHDSSFYLDKAGKRLAVMRLNNPHIRRPGPAADMPYVLAATAHRIAHELAAYTLGASHQLTPQPLFHTHDALVCRYVPFKPLHALGYRKAWDTFLRANRAIAALHAAGLTHMDISPNNILAGPSGDRFIFIDFEYTPVAGLSIASQRAYDYLRLAESSWKFMPESIRGDYPPWLNDVVAKLGEEAPRVQLERLAPALTRILAAPGLGEAIRRSFMG